MTIHVCFECGRTFDSVSALNAHRMIECEIDTRCNQCGQLCSSMISCANHKKTCEPPKLPKYSVCLFCGRVFRTSNEGIHHMANRQWFWKNVRTTCFMLYFWI